MLLLCCSARLGWKRGTTELSYDRDEMFLKTPVGILAFVISCFSSLFLIGVGFWVLRRVKLPCLPWIIACWGLNFPLLELLNSWFLDYLIGAPSSANELSLSQLGLFSKRDAIRQYMAWYYFLASVGFFAIVLLVVADVTPLVHELRPNDNDKVPRAFGLVRTFSPVFGFSALVLAMVHHILSLLASRISP